MRGRLADGHAGGRYMTSGTASGDIGVIHRYRTNKRCRRHAMTIIASIGSRRMSGALGQTNTTGDMAIHAHAWDNLAVVDGKHLKRCRRNAVAKFAIVGGLRMSGRLADGCRRSRRVTRNATGSDIGMIHRHRACANKRGWRHAVTIIAFIRGERMSRALADGDTAGRMTINAHTRYHLGMINGKGGK